MNKIQALVLILILTGCSAVNEVRDSGPGRDIDVSHVPDAIPERVSRTRAGNKNPYSVLGKTYYLLAQSDGYEEVGEASWYGRKFHGRRTANGEVYDMYKMTAAHKTLPIPSYVKVTNLDNQKSVVVRVNDRGPFHGNRIIDLSYAAAKRLDFHNQGVARVKVEDVTPTYDEPVVTQLPQPVIEVEPQAKEIGIKQAYYQIGAFLQSDAANKLQNSIEQWLSYPVTVIQSATDQWYRVKVGPINPEALSEVGEQLNSAGIQYHLVYR